MCLVSVVESRITIHFPYRTCLRIDAHAHLPDFLIIKKRTEVVVDFD